MINEFVDPRGKLFVPGSPETVPALAAVLTAYRQAGLPVVHVVREHSPDGTDVESVRRRVFHQLGGFCLAGSWGAEVIPELAPLPGETVVFKHGWSAFFRTALHRHLRQLGVDTVVVGGTQTPNCIRSTVYDATALGYDVILLRDGTSSATPEVQRANLHDLDALGIDIVDCAKAAAVRAGQRTATAPQAHLRPPRREERTSFTRLALETVREGDPRLDRALRLPIVSWWARRVLHDLFHRRGESLFLEVHGQYAGIVVWRPVRDALRIEALGVVADFRRRGWGTWLLARAAEEARRRGLARLELEVSPKNESALALYWETHFRPIPKRWGALWLDRQLPPEST
jgi:nicotinamidase-related amidase